jgi:hypothetical protein
MERFWQNTHRRLQPEKNTVPEPRVPLMGGSSHKWGAMRETYRVSGIPHTPCFPARRSAPQARGQRVQLVISVMENISLFRRFSPLLYNNHEKIASFLVYFFANFGLQTAAFVV